MVHKQIININGRKIGSDYDPFIIAEIGINHGGNIGKACKMIDAAYKAGCECIKFQTHIIEDEMIPNNVIPGNAVESIWDIIKKCSLTEDEEFKLKKYTESKGMIFLSTPFSRAAADRLEKFKVSAYKIGSGECNNYPLIEHIAKFGKPVILSTGMNNLKSIGKAVEILDRYKAPYAILHCTSIYPTPYEKVRLGSLKEIRLKFSRAVIGLSDHSKGIYTCLGAVALGASILEKHFTAEKSWSGPDISISITPEELKELIIGSRAIHKALGGKKQILEEERQTINFAYACVVAIQDINKGDKLSKKNIWVKRPGTGEIKAEHFSKLLGKKAKRNIKKDAQIRWNDY